MSWQQIEALAERFGSHSDFDRAVLTHTRGILRFRHEQRGVMKLLAKEERYRAFNILICMVCLADLNGGHGISFTQFYDACTRHAGVSDRTARTVLQLAEHYGFVGIERDESDRRVRRYCPRERFWNYASGWLAPSIEGFRILGQPEPPLPAADLVRRTFASCTRDYIDGSLRFYHAQPGYQRVFAQLEGGSLVCMAAIEACLTAQRPPSQREIAARYGLSRAQVAHVMNEGRAAGLFAETAGICPTQQLIDLYREAISLVLAFLAFHEQRGAELPVSSNDCAKDGHTMEERASQIAQAPGGFFGTHGVGRPGSKPDRQASD